MANELANKVAKTRPHTSRSERFVVLTGGEPTLQVDAVHAEGFSIAIEIHGTIVPAKGLAWVCVTPKAPPWRTTAGRN